MKLITDFKGFSGCKIKLYFGNGIYFVRKISKSVDYNNRLKAQMTKQEYFLNNIATEKITAPKIFKTSFVNGLFFFDMEYVRGINLIGYIYDANINELSDVSKNICSIIDSMKKHENEAEYISLESFEKKIDDIKNSLKLKYASIDMSFLDDLKNELSKTQEYKEIKKTFCHGDLTMENIIYDKINKKYYLIDFLDSFIEHYWFDIAKLFQDIEGKWYKFRNPKININNMLPKMNFINRYLRDNVFSKEKVYFAHHNSFLALNFARILPYAEEKDIAYLINKTKENLEKFQQ